MNLSAARLSDPPFLSHTHSHIDLNTHANSIKRTRMHACILIAVSYHLVNESL